MLHILLPVHNRAKVTARFLQALRQQQYQDYCLWVIDDGCTDETLQLVELALPAERRRVLSGDGSLWWAGALQLGYQELCALPAADHDAVLICNDDMGFETDFLASGLALLGENPGAAIQAEGRDVVSGFVDHGARANLLRLSFRDAGDGSRVNCLSTRGLLMSGRAFRQSGGFHPALLPHYLSDYEFTLRLHRQGVRLLTDPRFHATIRLELTGHQGYNCTNVRQFWKDAFSNRAKYNPRHWTAFVLMTCPAWIAPLHIARIWLRFALAFARAALLPVRSGNLA